MAKCLKTIQEERKWLGLNNVFMADRIADLSYDDECSLGEGIVCVEFDVEGAFVSNRISGKG